MVPSVKLQLQFSAVDADLGFEPLTMRINEAGQGERCPANLCGKGSQVIKGFFGLRVEDVVGRQVGQAGVFIIRQGRNLHRPEPSSRLSPWCVSHAGFELLIVQSGDRRRMFPLRGSWLCRQSRLIHHKIL